jgi:hypothetical protein
MSPEECRAYAEACDRMAESLGPDNAGLRDTMREVAEQWRRLAADAEARRQSLVLSQRLHAEARSAAGKIQGFLDDITGQLQWTVPAAVGGRCRRLWRKLQPLATDKMPLEVPPPRRVAIAEPRLARPIDATPPRPLCWHSGAKDRSRLGVTGPPGGQRHLHSGEGFSGCAGGSGCGGFPKGGQKQGVTALRFHRGRARYASRGQPPR